MATIDIHNLSGEKVGTLDLADEVFGAVNEDLLWEAVKHYRAAQRAGTHATKNKKLVSGAGKKLWKQKGTGRARVGSIRSPLWRHGGTVHGPQPRSYDYAFPRKKLLGALRSALAAKFADGKLIVVNAFDVKEPKSKLFRQALDALKVDTHGLAGRSRRGMAIAIWTLSSRNIDGVELVNSSEVHPYHLLRYDRAIFSQPAIEKLQVSLKNSVSKRQHKETEEESAKKATARSAAPRASRKSGGGGLMKTAYQIIRRPVITEKGLAIKENQNTLVFQVAPKATKTEIKEAVQSIFKVKVHSVRTATYPGKERRRGKFAGYRPDWKKAYVRLKVRRKNAGVRAEFVIVVSPRSSAVSKADGMQGLAES